jgi:hypothetical protein
MGTWDAGNFDNDSARDFLAVMMDRWISIIGEPPPEASQMELAPGLELIEGCVMPTAELLIATIERFEEAERVPTPKQVTGWSELALAAYDSEIEGFDPDEEYKRERRRVIADTFARLLAIAESHEQTYGPPLEE